jgi:hypothetical protein
VTADRSSSTLMLSSSARPAPARIACSS